MSARIAALIGATGLIGGYLLNLLLDDPDIAIVRVLIRRPLDRQHPKLEKKLVDFYDADSLLTALDGCDTVSIAIGTTNKKVNGDQSAYRRIDYDIPVNIARYCRELGIRKLFLVSSVGANSRSRNFYLKLKGEVEDAIKNNGPQIIHFMRPSMLLGYRKESRPLEKIAQPTMRALSFLLPARFKPIHARDVALAMVRLSAASKEGVFIHEYEAIRMLTKS